MNEQSYHSLRMVSGILLRCWVLGFAMLLICFVAIELLRKPIYNLHGAMFGLGTHELDLIVYCAVGLMKLAVVTLFFIPWLAIKLSLRRCPNTPNC